MKLGLIEDDDPVATRIGFCCAPKAKEWCGAAIMSNDILYVALDRRGNQWQEYYCGGCVAKLIAWICDVDRESERHQRLPGLHYSKPTVWRDHRQVGRKKGTAWRKYRTVTEE